MYFAIVCQYNIFIFSHIEKHIQKSLSFLQVLLILNESCIKSNYYKNRYGTTTIEICSFALF